MTPHPTEEITNVVFSFFTGFKPLFSAAEYENLVLFVLGLLTDTRNKTVAGIARIDGLKDHTVLSKFLQSKNVGKVFDKLRQTFFALVDWNQTLYFYLDDTIVKKTGKKVRGEFNYSSSDKKAVKSNCFVISLVKSGEFALPFDVAKYFKKAKPFKSKIALAITMMQSFLRRVKPNTKVVFVFDTWYATKKIVNAVRKAKAFFITRLKSNRKVHGGKLRGSLTLEQFAKQLPKKLFKKVKLANGRVFYVFSQVLSVNKVGVVKVVFTRKKKNGRKVVCLASNDVDSEEGVIIQQYADRWGIEQFFKELKNEFGFDEFQDVRQVVVSRHITLSLASYSLAALVKQAIGELSKTAFTMRKAVEKIRDYLQEVKRVLLQRLYRRKITNAID